MEKEPHEVDLSLPSPNIEWMGITNSEPPSQEVIDGYEGVTRIDLIEHVEDLWLWIGYMKTNLENYDSDLARWNIEHISKKYMRLDYNPSNI